MSSKEESLASLTMMPAQITEKLLEARTVLIHGEVD